MSADKLIVALDTTDLGQAVAWAKATEPHVGLFKLGLEFVPEQTGVGQVKRGAVETDNRLLVLVKDGAGPEGKFLQAAGVQPGSIDFQRG